jgi:hypothetical protein
MNFIQPNKVTVRFEKAMATHFAFASLGAVIYFFYYFVLFCFIFSFRVAHAMGSS